MKGRVSPYKSAIVDIDRNYIDEVLRRCSSVLGLPERRYDFELIYGDDSAGFGSFVPSAQPGLNRIALLRQDYEGSAFHEAVHYVMGQNGLFLMCVEGENLYSRLVDETVAELATSEVFGYEISPANFLEEALKHDYPDSEELKKLAQLTYLEPQYIMAMLRKEGEDFEVVKGFIDAETKYAAGMLMSSGERVQTVLRELHDFQAYFYSQEFRSQTGMASMIARYNAERMSRNNVHARKLVSWIDDGINHGNTSTQMFFENVADHAFTEKS
ncbi:MAG TPA: hypothetical protein VJH04_04180 [archaeon]|nr:hypothetical protein [archaeon]